MIPVAFVEKQFRYKMYAGLPILLLIFARVSLCHEPISTKLTWNREVSRLINMRCASCHRPDGTAMSLLTYAAARPWAVAISEEVLSRRMPPWGAIKGFGDFRSDMSLTQEEINLFAEWVAGGAPEGDAGVLRAPSSQAVEPDVPTGETLTLDRSVTLPWAIELLGIRPGAMPSGATVQLIARHPDGSIQPLLWLYDFQPAFTRTYVYKNAVTLPAGTKIEIAPETARPFTLVYRRGSQRRK
jgi:hypothetical protein